MPLLLDQPRWRIDDGAWQPAEEILRIDDQVRRSPEDRPPRRENGETLDGHRPAPILAQVQLKFVIQSDVEISLPLLAMEDAATISVQVDGRTVAAHINGWWVDEAIETISLPAISPGEHELLLTIPFTRKSNLEACYLLGDFGVRVAGRHARLIAPVRELAFGDWTHQGLPFYAGNVTYHCSFEGDGNSALIEIPKFKSPLLSVELDSKPAGKIAFAPFQLELGKLKGRHALDITAFGNRVNTFGALHNANDKLTWFGPPAWRQTGTSWSYEYQFKPMGVLVAPMVKVSA